MHGLAHTGRYQPQTADSLRAKNPGPGIPDFCNPGGVWSRMKPVEFDD